MTDDDENVSEWCENHYYDYGTPARGDPSTDPNRVMRGGSFGGVAASARSAYRNPAGPGSVAIDVFGLRPARALFP